MFNPLTILSSAMELGKTYLEGRNVKSKTKAEAEAEVMKTASKSVADWESYMAKNNGQSWKDEWLTLLFSIPLIMAFVPAWVPYVDAGFEVLERMPEWYQYTLSVIVAASFAVRSAIGFIGAKK